VALCAGRVAWDFIVAHWEIIFVLVLIAVMLVIFITEIFPIEITALAVLAALGLSGILAVDQVLSGFSSHATITVLMMFILSAGVVQSGIVDWLGDHMGVLMGKSTIRHVIVIGLIAGPVSAFINNTAAVAVMIPLVIHLANKMGDSPSKLLIPLSYAAMLGGVTTVIGTSTNLLGSTLRADVGLGHFGIFEFTHAGLIIFGVGLLYLGLIGTRFLPERIEARKLDEKYHYRSFLFEVEIPERSNLINKRVGKAELSDEYDAEIIIVHRGEKSLDPASEPVYYQPGDRVIMHATRANLQRMSDRGIVILKTTTGDLELEKEDLDFREFLVTSTATSRGKRLGRLQFWSSNHLHPVALLTRGRTKHSNLYNHRLRTGDVVLAAATKEHIGMITGGDAFHVLGGPAPPLRRPHKVPHVILILIGVIGFAAFDIFPIVYTAIAGAVLMVMTGALRITDMYESIRWDVVFLLAGVIPLGIAMQDTGTAALVGVAIANSSTFLPPIVLLALFFLSVSILTEIVSNNASVVLMIPIGIEIAAALGYNPTTFILAAMFAASTSFLSPVGYQTNLMVMGPGGYKYLDYLRIGAPLNLLMVIVSPLVLNWFWPLV
jgi:di/tricarboxylate transporter